MPIPFYRWIVPSLALAACVGCAQKRPVLYPNYQLEQVGPVVAQADIDACLASAAASGLEANPAGRVATSTATRGATGAAVGAAAGAVRGRAGRGAAMGSAGAGASGFMHGLFRWREPDPLQARFVNICLSEQGYKILGWK